MKKLFISGSIRIKSLDDQVRAYIGKVMEAGDAVLVGDAGGVDSAVQSFLHRNGYENVTIFCSGNAARNNIGRWPVQAVETRHKKNTRLFFTAKDIEMAKACDSGLMVWDSKSTGTLSNIRELASRGKASVVFVNRTKTFVQVNKSKDFEELLSLMPESALEAAVEKIGLHRPEPLDTVEKPGKQMPLFP